MKNGTIVNDSVLLGQRSSKEIAYFEAKSVVV